jgi:YVTN family beta-propeller protein
VEDVLSPTSVQAIRRALGRLVVTTLAAGVLAAPAIAATPAAAETVPPDASTETLLDGVTAATDVATGGGKVFVAATDRVVVADLTGAVIDSIGALPGATGLATSADGARLYVALRDSGEVAEIDAATLAELRRIPVGSSYPCPRRLALDGTRLVIGYGCDQWGGGVLAVDVSAASPEIVPIWTDGYGAPLVAAAGGVIATGSAGLSPAQILVYAVEGSSATLRGVVPAEWGGASNLQDVALTRDGSSVIQAAGWPYYHAAYDTTTLTETRRYGDGLGYYPNAVTVSPDGAYVALGRGASRVLSVHRVADGGLLSEADPTHGDLVDGSLAFAGEDVFGLVNDWPNGRYYLWRVAGATLPTSSVSLTGPASATALDPLTLTGRLTFSDGAAPGVATLTVTRSLADGSTATLPSVTTAADGTFSITDRPQDAGSVTYTATWAGDSGHRGSSGSFTVLVESRSATLTLTGPATSEAGKRIRLSGSLLLDGTTPKAGATLEVHRSITNNLGSDTVRLADVITDNQGGFRFSDTPTHGGSVDYTVRWTGATGYAEASATHRVTVSSTAAAMTAVVDEPAYAAEPFWVAGGITYEVGQCVGLKTVTVTRQVGSGPVEQRPALTTNVDCSFRFQDTVATPTTVRYTFSWAGDSGHVAASTAVTGTVQQQPSYVQAYAEDYYLKNTERPAISGMVAGSRTGPLGTAVTLRVTRTNPDGSVVKLKDVTSARDGTFAFRDSLPKVDPTLNPPFTYEISWAGNTVYSGSSAAVTVYVTATG